jgi:hypothetical protein
MNIWINQVGFAPTQPKKAVLSGLSTEQSVNLVAADRRICGSFVAQATEFPADWKLPTGLLLDFSSWTETGTYRLEIPGVAESAWFEIASEYPAKALLSDLLFYYKGQRSSGLFERADRNAPFFGGLRRERKDVHGGWYDASGDMSKYLSHLSYARFMNPQQTPLVVWALLRAEDAVMERTGPYWERLRMRIVEEAAHGADFLVRMQDQDGSFWRTLFDKWSKDPEQREICSYSTQQGIKDENFAAGAREGGGMTVAALARAARRGERGDLSPVIYRDAAEKGYEALRNWNRQYLEDSKENLLDEYCMLLAAVELYHLTQDPHYSKDASIWANAVLERQMPGGWLRVSDESERPFFHASDAGLPWFALWEYAQIESDTKVLSRVYQALSLGIQDQIGITQEVENPFGLARQWVQGTQSPLRTSFFVPHDNESGYWWQGENARLGSLASLSFLLAQDPRFVEFSPVLERFAQDQLDWILGCNPQDRCMLQGHGRNNPKYEEGFPNAPGGVCNGFTSRFEDDRGFQFGPANEEQDVPHQRWRWAEQWIPHGAWFFLALCLQVRRSPQ